MANKQVSTDIQLGNRRVNHASPVYFIAEIGNNHNGDFYLAKRTIEAAAKAGADAVKFQKRFISETFTKELRDKPQTKDQVLGATYGEYRQNLELNEEEFKKLKVYAEELGMTFFATPFDLKGVDFLEDVGQPIYKISSFDTTNIPLLTKVAKLGKPMILSTGMTSFEEIDEAVNTILAHNDQLILLYCVSIYPTPDEHMNLATFDLMKQRYAPMLVGYSGHEKGILASLVTIARGARVVERHFTLDKNLPGPDHATVSITPEEFKMLVDETRRIEAMMGTASTGIHELEQNTRNKHGKSITSRTEIKAGTVITEDMLCVKSPGTGLKSNMLATVIGKTAARDIAEDATIGASDITGLS